MPGITLGVVSIADNKTNHCTSWWLYSGISRSVKLLYQWLKYFNYVYKISSIGIITFIWSNFILIAIIFGLSFSSVLYLLEDSYSPIMGLMKNLAHSRNSITSAKQVNYSTSTYLISSPIIIGLMIITIIVLTMLIRLWSLTNTIFRNLHMMQA